MGLKVLDMERAGTVLIGLRELLLGRDLLMLAVKQFPLWRGIDYGAVLFG